ncbi:Putative alpha helix protein [Rubrivivax sp. A210]|uniref:ribosome biogenesis factor YjgA n=1 Tax=Rubrivivax sp. A210 TaxID=2772301 RepID=UPI001919293D|nr:ribosome biogenesis factor YjgA [Rubrivivax sp. A210]CAD5374510.1 Putative alpha helix protein [Rubrivivax sp. A210]
MARRAAPHRGIDIHYGDSDVADGADARPSKTQLKQKSHELQDLGEALAALPEERLAGLEMSDALRDALVTWHRTKSHEGRRRQMQYVGKLMRGADEEALREAVAQATLGSAQAALALHEAERWRAELIADDDAMTRWLDAHPDTDTQQLRSLVRAARRDAAALPPEARQPKSFRELFQYIRPRLNP